MKLPLPRFALVIAATFAPGGVGRAQERVLTKAIEIRSLSFDEARTGLAVRLRGTVTFIEGSGAVFVQDETAGSFFRPEKPDQLRPGDIVEVTGRTQPGNYLPGIALAPYRIIGHGPLPAAVTVGHDDLTSGRYHYQRVAIEGIARSVTPVSEGHSVLRVDVASRIVEVWLDAGIEDEGVIVDSRVRVEGLAAGGINRRRQLVQPYLRTRDDSEITVLEPAVPEAAVPRIAASNLLTFRVAGQGNHRIRIDGVVTACPSKVLVFVRNGQTAFGLRFFSPTTVEVGDRIDVLGFTEMGRFSATVVDARLLAREAGASPVPQEIDIPGLLGGTRDGDLVAVTAELTDLFRSENGVVLALQRGGHALQARGPAMNVDLSLGSLVRVTGICEVESSTSVVLSSRPASVVLQIRTPEDIAVLASPSPWTMRRLLGVLSVLAAVTLLAVLWIAILRRQVRRQTAALRERIESEAALEERQRIAREFHDSLEQDLTGLGLRLDAAATRMFDEKGRQIITVSRGLLSRIQAETKNFVSDLRDSTEHDLATALDAIATRHSGEVEVRAEFAVPPPPLPGSSIHHLRMIARESVTNALKHTDATQVVIHVDIRADGLAMHIRDNGRGFNVQTETLGKSGHFGCVGIRERARKIGAQVAWHSTPGQGTVVEVILSLAGGPKGSTATRSRTPRPEPASAARENKPSIEHV
ncbi:MAG: sensor histidine kinase [Opitutus sp.]|nr:sensor histidine kinase [Opitutus sp.]